MFSAWRIVLGITALVIFGSSCCLLAVDIAGRVMNDRWRKGEPVNRSHWLTELAIVDPKVAFQAGEQCIQSASQPQSCREFLEHSLKKNPRISPSEALLISLAEQRGDLHEAEARLENLQKQDRSFRSRWLEWNFWLRTGKLDRFRDKALDIAREAPATFRGDFPLLLLTGEDYLKHADAMLEVHHDARALDYAAFLDEQNTPGASELLAYLIGNTERSLAREAALRFITRRLHERRGVNEAGAVWTQALHLGLVEDHRVSPADDAIQNSNPRLRMPFVAQSFDWSITENPRVTVSPVEDGGVRLEIHHGAPARAPILSKAIIAPEGPCHVHVAMSWGKTLSGEEVAETQQSRVYWEAYDTLSERIIARTAPADQPCGSACSQFDLLLNASTSTRVVYMLLKLKAGEADIIEPQAFTISAVDFAIIPSATVQ